MVFSASERCILVRRLTVKPSGPCSDGGMGGACPDSRRRAGIPIHRAVGLPSLVIRCSALSGFRSATVMLRAAASTDVGLRRQANEDRYAMAPELGLYLVADGMGGHRRGRWPARLAAEAAIRAVEACRAPPSAWPRSSAMPSPARIARSSRRRASDARLAGMGTTLVSLLVDRRARSRWPTSATAGPTCCGAGASAA